MIVDRCQLILKAGPPFSGLKKISEPLDFEKLVPLLPRHGRKAFTQFLKSKDTTSNNSSISNAVDKENLYRTVKHFCAANPNIKNVDSVLRHCSEIFDPESEIRTNGRNKQIDSDCEIVEDTSEPPRIEGKAFILHDAEDLTWEDSSGRNTSSGFQRADSVQLSPTDKILRIFPDASKSHVQTLLDQQAAALASSSMLPTVTAVGWVAY